MTTDRERFLIQRKEIRKSFEEKQETEINKEHKSVRRCCAVQTETGHLKKVKKKNKMKKGGKSSNKINMEVWNKYTVNGVEPLQEYIKNFIDDHTHVFKGEDRKSKKSIREHQNMVFEKLIMDANKRHEREAEKKKHDTNLQLIQAELDVYKHENEKLESRKIELESNETKMKNKLAQHMQTIDCMEVELVENTKVYETLIQKLRNEMEQKDFSENEHRKYQHNADATIENQKEELQKADAKRIEIQNEHKRNIAELRHEFTVQQKVYQEKISVYEDQVQREAQRHENLILQNHQLEQQLTKGKSYLHETLRLKDEEEKMHFKLKQALQAECKDLAEQLQLSQYDFHNLQHQMTELETSYTQKTREVQQRLYEESHTRQATQNSLADEQKQNERLLESKATLVAEHQDLKAQYAALENEQSRQSTELYELKIKADQQARVLENQKAELDRSRSEIAHQVRRGDRLDDDLKQSNERLLSYRQETLTKLSSAQLALPIDWNV